MLVRGDRHVFPIVTSAPYDRLFASQVADLERLEQVARRRRLSPRAGHDFSSNDYLGLANSPELIQAAREAIGRGVPIGSGGSRLLRGNHEEHEMLEREATQLFGCESALYFSTGYAANSALIATLPQSDDLIVYDELVHASIHEGLRLTRARHAPFEHNDAGQVESLLRTWREGGGKGRPWIVVESLYSMDGDQAPLGQLGSIADRYEAILVIDEAHATGVFGDNGTGLAGLLAGRENIIAVRTCGKALGCEGALVCGPSTVREFLINRGRGFIFSTAPSPLMAALVRSALQIMCDQPERRKRLHSHIRRAAKLFAELGLPQSGSQIMPVIIGSDSCAIAAASQLQEAGFDIRAIRPPTVPAGTSRLRISITLNVDGRDIDELGDSLKLALANGLAVA